VRSWLVDLVAVGRDLLTALLPGTCPGCGRRGEPCCARCRPGLTPAPHAPPPPGVDWWVAPYAYDGVVRELVAHTKYRAARSSIRWLAEAVAAACPAQPVDVVTWPPASVARLRAHGVDHAGLLARAVARHLDRPVRPLLDRMPGPAQTGASWAQRRAGPQLRALQSVRGMNVLIVDDVATTGATLTAAARALRDQGAATIGAATATRTPLPRRA